MGRAKHVTEEGERIGNQSGLHALGSIDGHCVEFRNVETELQVFGQMSRLLPDRVAETFPGQARQILRRLHQCLGDADHAILLGFREATRTKGGDERAQVVTVHVVRHARLAYAE